ncbi:MAG TPA: V-type ATP synthase subunit B [Woeseiaceae bacterium]|nr:V-type ATP synthase subunit B [Woeseiaceae bacterium]
MEAEITLTGAAQRLEGPLLFLQRTVSVGLDAAVEVIGRDGSLRYGRVAALGDEEIVVEILGATEGLSLGDTRVRIREKPLELGLGPGLQGRILDSLGRPIDGGPPIPAERYLAVDGSAINPVARHRPQDFIETGVTAIDLMNSLVRGQKLPLFSGGGLPHDRLAIDIASRARLLGEEAGAFAIVFVGIGVSHDTAERFRASMQETGALEHTVMFLNRASEPSTQRLLTPRYALTAAEYLAFVESRHVLVIMTDMTNYCEALREVSAGHGEIPSRKGYPGYLYSDLATIYERAGCLRARQGTLTQLPILTMPGDDITHPIPDLTGYITEGQIVLSRELDRRGVYPPIDVLASLSRLMDDGIGKGVTHADHPALAHQLFAAYARTAKIRVLASVMGHEGLTETDRQYLDFGDAFEQKLIAQEGPRRLDESMKVGWEILQGLPRAELSRLSEAQVAEHLGEPEQAGDGAEGEPREGEAEEGDSGG